MEILLVAVLLYGAYARDSVGQILLGFVMFCCGLVALAVLLVVLFFVWCTDELLGYVQRWINRRFDQVFGGWV